MTIALKASREASGNKSIIVLSSTKDNWEKYGLSKKEASYIEAAIKQDQKLITINQYKRWVIIQLVPEEKNTPKNLETLRKAGNDITAFLNKNKEVEVSVTTGKAGGAELLALAEGMALGNYQFLKYRADKDKKTNTLATINIVSTKVKKEEITQLSAVVDATFKARNLVNEPLSYLDAIQFSKEFEAMGKEAGMSVEVLNEAKIESLKMGGILAVNRGSQTPPTFTIMEWKPKGAKNKKPIVLVGKGVVYDTGGLSLKPTPNSMDYMKCDMGGGAAVAGAIYAAAKAKLPLHIVALVPATDNRPGEDAYVPGDVITMYGGKTVEVLNTDAEGRMILADALEYAKKFKPEMVLNFATLTGSAAAAIGPVGIVCMGNVSDAVKDKLKTSGDNTYERLVEFPFWDEYGELMKSDIADLKNLGPAYAGSITAGKFLENFTDYPFMHFDIAGGAFTHSADSYRGKGGTALGVRLLFDYFKNY